MPDTDKPFDLEFPLGGINVAGEFQEQPPGTAADAVNVRGLNPDSLRERGGSRAGLFRYIPGPLFDGADLIQHLNVIVDPTGEAFQQNFEVPGDDWVEDPLNPGFFFPPGGWGYPGGAPEPTAAITRIQAKRTKFSPPGATETISFASSIVNQNTAVVGIVTLGNSSAIGVGVTNGGVTSYTQVGSYIEILDPRTVDSYVRLSVWKKTLNSGSDDDSIKVTPTDTLVTMAVVQIEYNGMPTSGQVDTAVTNSDDTNPPPAPATTGNVAILGDNELLLGFFATILDPSGFTAGAGFSLVPDEDDGNPLDLRLNVVEKIGLNTPGDNPTAATGTTTGGEDPYVAIGASFKKS